MPCRSEGTGTGWLSCESSRVSEGELSAGISSGKRHTRRDVLLIKVFSKIFDDLYFLPPFLPE